MESMEVNWEALDALVIDFAKSEHLMIDEDSSSSLSSSSSSTSSSSLSYQSRLLIRQIRRSLEAGDVDSAFHLLRLHAPFILDDHRLLFLLQKQKFIELLRKGTADDRDSAIHCLRTALAPCALDAYPEAYEEFKHVLLAFIYDKNDQTSPVANEWSERRRLDIAGLLSSVLRAHLNAYDPVFSMTLRYLISIHKGFCLCQGIASPISNLTERLLLEERDFPASPHESLYEAPPFDEVDIQALAHAVELTRQGAVDSLRFAKGDLFQAFQNELCRMRLDVPVLDEIVHEYCIYRGIVHCGPASPSASRVQSESVRVNEMEPGCLSRNCSCEVKYEENKHSDVETSVIPIPMEISPERSVDVLSIRNTDSEERCPFTRKGIHEDCSTSGTHSSENLKALLKTRFHGNGERNKRKRWRGRHEELEFISEAVGGSRKQDFSSTTLLARPNYSKEQQVSEKLLTTAVISNWEDKYELFLGMKELVSRGMAAEVVEEVNAIDSNFFMQNPILLFQLKQVEFLKLVKCGDHSGALKVACSHLGPLAASDPTLLKPLKETLLALLKPNEEALGECLPLYALATSLQLRIIHSFIQILCPPCLAHCSFC